MTPDEYRAKHRRCRTCVYYGGNRSGVFNYKCAAKEFKTKPNKGRFCRIYKAKEFEE